ncbi:MAG: DUF5684 domain-containing protein [Flavobacteriales bacterium]|nr:DUF5684 domain-containing protein [Flavobacteriales bacterium]
MLSAIILIISLVGMGFTLQKAGRELWEGMVPIYNFYVLTSLLGKPIWWFILLFVPFVNIAIAFLLYLELSKRFGKGGLFAVLLLFLPFIGFAILGFSKNETYKG